MGVPTNIDLFNKVVAKTLLTLYDSFPKPVDLDPLMIGLDVLLGDKIPPGSESLLAGNPEATIEFLVSEGFIRYDPRSRTLDKLLFPDSVLTAKGLALLQRVPESVDQSKDRRSYVERLKAATASGIKASIPEVVGAVVGQMLGAG